MPQSLDTQQNTQTVQVEIPNDLQAQPSFLNEPVALISIGILLGLLISLLSSLRDMLVFSQRR